MTNVDLYVCENYAPEISRVCEMRGWADVSVVPFPCVCLYKGEKEKASERLAESMVKGNEIEVLCSKHCDLLPAIPPGIAIETHPADFCFSHLVSEPFISYAIAKGGYIVSSGWLMNWRDRIAAAGFDQETAIHFYHSFCRELVYLDTDVFAEGKQALAELSRFLDLPYVIIPVDLNTIALWIEKTVSARRLHAKTKAHSQSMAELQVQCAEYAAIFDLMGRIAAYSNRRDMIEKVKEIFMLVFGAQQFKYWNHDYGKDSMPEEIKSFLLDQDRDVLFFEEANRFCLKIMWKDKLFGAVEVSEFMFPAYIKKYLNFAIEIVKICGLVFSNNEQYEKILKSEQELRDLGTHDALTGLYNRAYVNELLQHQTPAIPFTVFMFDIDRLKTVNDSFGHAEGDKLIAGVAGILKKCIRETDILARIGGDEFVAILQGIDGAGAGIIKERIHQHIEIHNRDRKDVHLQISFSMGYAVGEVPEDTVETLMKMADNLMYRDKAGKRA